VADERVVRQESGATSQRPEQHPVAEDSREDPHPIDDPETTTAASLRPLSS
jgi:hypothetical protein